METKTESSAVVNATKNHLEKFKSTSFLAFNASLSMLRNLKEKSLITGKDFNDAAILLSKKYGLKNNNLFVANDLI
jgi:hypothetical protein